MNLINSINYIKNLKDIPNRPPTNYIYSNNGNNIFGWTWDPSKNQPFIQGGIAFGGGLTNYVGYNVKSLTTFNNRTILLNATYNINGYIDLLFACDSSGSGQMFRIQGSGANSIGFSTTISWLNRTAPSSSQPITTTSSITLVIEISSSGVATFTYNGNPGITSYTINNNGSYIGVASPATMSIQKIQIT